MFLLAMELSRTQYSVIVLLPFVLRKVLLNFGQRTALSSASSELSQSRRRCSVKRTSPLSFWGTVAPQSLSGVVLSVVLSAVDFVVNEIDLQKAMTVGKERKINNLCALFYQVVFPTVL